MSATIGNVTLPIYTRFDGVEHELGTMQIPIRISSSADRYLELFPSDTIKQLGKASI